MVASQHEEVLGVFDLVGQKQTNGFKRLLAPVHVVTEEQVVTLGRETTILKQSQQIIILTMDVT